MNPEIADELAEIYKAASNKNRITILDGIQKGMTLSEITRVCKITPQGVQKHVGKLQEANLMEVNKEKGNYQLTEGGVVILENFKKLENTVRVKIEKKVQDLKKRLEGTLKEAIESPYMRRSVSVKEFEKALESLRKGRK